MMRVRTGDIYKYSTIFDPQRPRVNYYAARNEEVPFPDPSQIHERHDKEEEEVKNSIVEMILKSSSDGLPKKMNRSSFKLSAPIRKSSARNFPAADVPHIQVNLTPEAKTVRLRLRNYSPEQRCFLKSPVDELIRCNMDYLNPSTTWASAPILVSNPGPDILRFTTDL